MSTEGPDTGRAFEEYDTLFGTSGTTNATPISLEATNSIGFSIRNITIGSLGLVLNLTALILIIITTNIKTPVKVTIIALIISDLTFMVGLVFHNLYQMISSFAEKSQFCWCFIFLIFLSTIASQQMTAVLSIYNLLAVFSPHSFRNISVKSSKFICICFWIFSAIISLTCMDWTLSYGPSCIPAASIIWPRVLGFVLVMCISTLIVISVNASILWRFRSFPAVMNGKSKSERPRNKEANPDRPEPVGIPSPNSGNGPNRVDGEEDAHNRCVAVISDESKSKPMRKSTRSYYVCPNVQGEQVLDVHSASFKRNASRFILSKLRKGQTKIGHLDGEPASKKNRIFLRYLTRTSSEPDLSVHTHRIPDTSPQCSFLSPIAGNLLTPPTSTFSGEISRSPTSSSFIEQTLTTSQSSDVSRRDDDPCTTKQNTLERASNSKAPLGTAPVCPFAASASASIATTVVTANPTGERVRNNGSKLRHGAITLIILSLWSCLLSVPFTVYAIWLTTHEAHQVKTLALRPAGVFSSTLLGVNSLGNPFLYAWRFINWAPLKLRVRELRRRLTR